MKVFDSEKFKALFEASGLSASDLVRELSRRCPVSKKPSGPAVKAWIDGKTKPSADYIGVLSEIFGLEIEDFYTKTEV